MNLIGRFFQVGSPVYILGEAISKQCTLVTETSFRPNVLWLTLEVKRFEGLREEYCPRF